jgi:Na+/melibiose symporter-like transporter
VKLFPDHGLWRNRGFLRLWAAQVLSAFGARITRTALPVIAVSVLAASATEVAVLSAMAFVPGLALAMVAGGWIDRSDRRAILVGADVVRALAVTTVPLAAWLDALTLAHLVAVAGVVGAASALFQITDNAYLPELVVTDELIDANAKIETTESMAEITGPPAAGVLIAAIGGPVSMLVTTATYLWSAAWLTGLPRTTPAPADPQAHPLADLRAGLRALWSRAELRALITADMVNHLAAGFFVALYMVYTLRELALGEATVGIVIGFGGVGALGGALIARRLGDALGLGPALFAAMIASRAANLLIPAAAGPHGAVLALLIVHQLVGDGFAMAFNIHAVTVRQTVLPTAVLGRANAAVHVLTVGALLVGTVIAGVVGDLVDARTGLWVGAGLGMLAPLPLLSLRGLRALPG